MSVTAQNTLTEEDLSLTNLAQTKMAELIQQVDENIQGVRVYASPGGCSGISFGMAFTDRIDANDEVLECEGVRVIVDSATMDYLRGVEIDFIDRGEGNASFVFNNLQPMGGGGCGTCGSSGGGCG
jgi:iron-sulfur cluster insertion protein